MARIFDFRDADRFEEWVKCVLCRHDPQIRQDLVLNLLKPLPRASVLDIGCGTGRDLEFFAGQGHPVAGVDPSAFMLDAARTRLGNRAELYRCSGEDLPFDDNSFDIAILIHTLEFVEDPEKVFAEACRVARNRVFVGCINRHAFRLLDTRKNARQGMNPGRPPARLFSVGDLKRMVHRVLGDVPVRWRTAYYLPRAGTARGRSIERSPLLQRSPWGAFVGVVVAPVPRFRLRPLPLDLRPRENHCLAGSMSLVTGWEIHGSHPLP